jgi:hypothetical protein
MQCITYCARRQALLQRRVNINAHNRQGQTPLERRHLTSGAAGRRGGGAAGLRGGGAAGRRDGGAAGRRGGGAGERGGAGHLASI